MRIRKRKVPLPLSLLSPIPLTDPHLFSRSPVMLVQDSSGATTFHSQPSDLLTLTDLPRLNGDTGVEGVLQASNDDSSKASLTSTKGGASPTDDNNNNNAVGKWCDGDKEVPLKKRRANFNNSIEDANTATPAIMTKADLIKNADDGDGKDGDEKPATNANNNGNNTSDEVVAKKGSNKRGNTIMEGSRCSRVNGRGWRCCQPTLVGYSLCEHHLGKGRLRSMSSGSTSSGAKARMAKKKNNSSNGVSFALGRRDEHPKEADDSDEKKLETKGSFGNNKRLIKLGVVKARSLSSLLGQTNSMSSTGDHVTMEQQHDKLISNMEYQ